MLDDKTQETFIIIAAVIGIIFGVINIALVLRIKVLNPVDSNGNEIDDEAGSIRNRLTQQQLYQMKDMAQLIQDGADTFLKTQYFAISIFILLFAVLIKVVVEKQPGDWYVTIAFLIGSITSIASGYIGMWISVRANVRVTKTANSSLADAFVVAFRGGIVLGFTLVGLGLLNLILIIIVYKRNFLNPKVKGRDWENMFEAIAGYGLGGSAVALFGRVGGGIYTKAADVGADLVGKVVAGLDEDSVMNPGTIADNVGDNVGDIAGMGADLFGSLAESSCAALVISASSPQLIYMNGYYYPLLISAAGIIVCMFVTFISTSCLRADSAARVNLSLTLQLVVSTIVMTPVLYVGAHMFVPAKFTLTQAQMTVTNQEAFYCAAMGLWAGLIIGYTTNYYTSGEFSPV